MLPNDKSLQANYEKIVFDTLLRLLPHDEGLQKMRKTEQQRASQKYAHELSKRLEERLKKAKHLYRRQTDEHPGL